MSNYLIISNINGDIKIFLSNLYNYINNIIRISKINVFVSGDVIYSLYYSDGDIKYYDYTNKIQNIEMLIKTLETNNVIRIECISNDKKIDIIPIEPSNFENSMLYNHYIFIIGNVFNVEKKDDLLFYLMQKFKKYMDKNFNIIINSNDIDYIQKYIDIKHINKYYELYSDFWSKNSDIVVAHRDIISNCVESLKKINKYKKDFNNEIINKINRANEYKKCIVSINTTIDQILELIYDTFKQKNNIYEKLYSEDNKDIRLIKEYFKNNKDIRLIEEYFKNNNENYMLDKYYDDKFINVYNKTLFELTTDNNDMLKIATFTILYKKIYYKIINLYNICKSLDNDFLDYIDRYHLTTDYINEVCNNKINIIKDAIDGKINNRYITLFNGNDLSYNLRLTKDDKNGQIIIQERIPKYKFDINDLIYCNYVIDEVEWPENIKKKICKAKLFKYYDLINNLAVKIRGVQDKNINKLLINITENIHKACDDMNSGYDKKHTVKYYDEHRNIFGVCIKCITNYIDKLVSKENNFISINSNNIKINNILQYFYKYYEYFYEKDYKNLDDIENPNYDMIKYKNGNLIIYASYDSSYDITLINNKLINRIKYMFVNKLNILHDIDKENMYNIYGQNKNVIYRYVKKAENIFVINKEYKLSMTFRWNNNIIDNYIYATKFKRRDFDVYMNNISNLYNDITYLQVLINNCIDFIQNPKYDTNKIIQCFLFIIYLYFSKINDSNYQIFNDSDKIFNDIGDMIKNNNIVYDNTQLVYKNISNEHKKILLNNIDKIITTFLNIDKDVMKQLYKKSELMHDNYKSYIDYMNFTEHDSYFIDESIEFTYQYIYSLMNTYSKLKYYKILQNYIDNVFSCVYMNNIDDIINIVDSCVNSIISQNEEIYYKIHKVAKAEYILIIKILSKIICHIPCLFIDLICNLKNNETDKIYNYDDDNNKITITKLNTSIDINPKLKNISKKYDINVQTINEQKIIDDYNITYDNDGNISFTIKP